MIKRIVLVLDGSEAGKVACAYAIDLAKKHHAELLGVAILDTPWLTAAQPEPLGGSAFKVFRDEEIIDATQSNIERVLQEFKAQCAQEEVSCQALEIEGFPANEIEIASYQGDVLVVGKTTDFHFDLDADSDVTVKHIAHDNPRPLLVIPKIPEKNGVILVAYDGEIASSRALHMFLLLNLSKGKHLHIVNVSHNSENGEELVSLAVNLCKAHGVKAESHILKGKASPEKALLELAEQMKPEMIVLGAFGHTLLRDVFFGSCSKTILKESTFPLFIHH